MTSQSENLRWLLRPRFSLRTILLATLLIGCVLSWFVSQTRLAIRQKIAVEQVRSLGGHATFEYELNSTRRTIAPPMPPAILRRFTGDLVMSDVVKVSLHSPHAVDGDIDALADLPRLGDLRLNARNLTDDGLRPVANLKQLRRLDLWCPEITDDAMPHLAGLHQLRQLDLYSTQVTDEGLEHLHGLSKLEELRLRGTHVTKYGAARIQKALPSCEILGVDGWPKQAAPTNHAVNRSGEQRGT